MTTLPLLRDVLSPVVVRALGYALLHSLWQGAVLALVLAGVLPLLRQRRAELRYIVAAAALGALVLAVSGTFGYYYQAAPAAGLVATPLALPVPPASHQALGHAAGARPTPVLAHPADWLQAASRRCEPYLPLLVGTWLLGTLLMGGRLLGGLLVASRLRRVGTHALGPDWQQRLTALAHRAGLRRPVALLESARVAGPLVLGHLRPVILLPLGAVAGLSPALLEALLAHEVAHIARRDYLLNLGLAVAEVLFFYHPAVWFIAACLRTERENCCDDQAAALCGGDGLRVARALAALAELEAAAAPTPHLALAAAGAGGRGSLLARVRRLALGRPKAPTLAEGVLAGLLALVGVLGLGTGVVLAAAPTYPARSLRAATLASAAPADTVRRPGAKKAAVTTPLIVLPLSPLPPNTSISGSGYTVTATGDTVKRFTMKLDERDNVADSRRAQASQPPQTVVVEKDKKGRLTKLTVNGQEMDVPGKKGKPGKAASTVEITTMPQRPQNLTLAELPELPEMPELPELPEHPEAPAGPPYHFLVLPDNATSKALRDAQRSLTLSLRTSNLNTAQRQEMQREMQRVQAQMRNYSRQFHLKSSGSNRFQLQFDQQHLTEANARQAEADARQAAADERQAQADMRQAEADARQAEADAREAGRETQRTTSELAARRAELRARIAAEQAELRTLNGSNHTPGYSIYGKPGRLKMQVRPVPPAPPAPPSQGRPGPPPPPPPAPPVSTDKLREALRQDGLIGKTDRNFSFELNDQGGKVNGQALAADQVARYRKLLRQPTSGKGKSSSYSVTINEK